MADPIPSPAEWAAKHRAAHRGRCLTCNHPAFPALVEGRKAGLSYRELSDWLTEFYPLSSVAESALANHFTRCPRRNAGGPA